MASAYARRADKPPEDARVDPLRLIARLEARGQVQTTQMARALLVRGMVEGDLGDDEAAVAAFERALAVQVAITGRDHPTVANIEAFLASALCDEWRCAEAEAHTRRALEIVAQSSGTEGPFYALYLNNLGEQIFYQGRYADALPMHLRALEIGEKLPAGSSLLAISLKRVGETYVAMGVPRRARPYLERAFAVPPSDDPFEQLRKRSTF